MGGHPGQGEVGDPAEHGSAEPDLAIKVIRDIFNEDFTRMVVSGAALRAEVDDYIAAVAPDLAERIESWTGPTDLFTRLPQSTSN